MPRFAALTAFFFSPASGALCDGDAVVEPDADWAWSTAAAPSPSCTSPAVVNTARMCSGDPTSVVINANGQEPQCISANMYDCKFNLHDLDQLDFDMRMEGCGGTWTAPLWMSPDTWKTDLFGGDSGEIDMLETCPAIALFSNFATGGRQKRWAFADPNNVTAHVTLKKEPDANGVVGVSVKACEPSEKNSAGECVFGSNSLFSLDHAHYNDIYSAKGCSEGDCVYRLVSDIWNGADGDGGRFGCTLNQWHRSSGCSFSVQRIRIKAKAGTFTGKCAALYGPSEEDVLV